MNRAALPLVALLALAYVPGATAQEPLQVTLDTVATMYGPETWKSVPETGGTWDESLGLRADVTVRVTRGGADTPEDWTYTATLSDGETVLRAGAQEGSGLRFLFDIDGQRALPGTAAVPPLVPGTWTLQVRATEPGPDGTPIPRGSGTTTLEASPVTFGGVVGDASLPGLAVPEHLLPGVQEVGPGPNAWMPAHGVSSGLTISVHAPALAEVTWTAWTRDAILPPFPAMVWNSHELGTTRTDEDGLARLQIPDPPLDAGLYFVAATLEGLGGTTFVLPVSFMPSTFTSVQAPDPGGSGVVQVTLESLATAPVQRLYALAQQTPGTTGEDLGGRLLAEGVLVGSGTLRGGFDATATRRAALTEYTLVAFLEGPEGYISHSSMRRGLATDLDVPTLGAGASDEVVFAVTNLAPRGVQPGPGLAVPTRAMAFLDGTEVGNQTVQVPAGGTIGITFPVRPDEPGSVPLEVEVDTGDLRFQIGRTVEVLDADAYDARPWYDPDRLIPAPGIGFLLVALALLARDKSVK